MWCVGPFVARAFGVSGAWIGALTALDPYRPFFIGLTLLFLASASHRLYFARRVCTPRSACANPRTLKHQRLAFWIVTVLALGLIAVPGFRLRPQTGSGLPPCFIDYEIANESFCPNRCSRRTSFHRICRTVTNEHSRCAKYHLCAFSDHSKKITRK